MERVVGVVAALERLQAPVGLVAVGRAHAVGPLVGEEVDVGAAGGVFGERRVDVAAPSDLRVVGLGVGPARDEVDDVGRVAVREGRAVARPATEAGGFPRRYL